MKYHRANLNACPGLNHYKNRPTLAMITAVFWAISLAGQSTAGELDAKISRISEGIIRSAQAHKLGPDTTLAVFPFTADDELSRKKVDFAVGEMVTGKLLASGQFRMVERSQLDSVMKEQALGQTGAITSESAAKVGGLIGAKLAVLGVVSRLGKTYQVAAKLVDTGSGEIIGSEIVEVASKLFDTEASRYLVLVPEQQRIGIYVTAGYGPLGITKYPEKSFAVTGGGIGYSGTVTPNDMGSAHTAFLEAGIGVRYFPTNWLMLDFAFQPLSLAWSQEGGTLSGPAGSGGGNVGTTDLGGLDFRLSANWVKPLGESFNGYVGAGVMLVKLSVGPGSPVKSQLMFGNGTSNIFVSSDSDYGHSFAYVLPFASLGAEWKPQSRVGIALFGQLLPGSAEYTQKVKLSTLDQNNVNVEIAKIPLYSITFPRIIIGTTVSLYF